jgi:hypothetical protein
MPHIFATRPKNEMEKRQAQMQSTIDEIGQLLFSLTEAMRGIRAAKHVSISCKQVYCDHLREAKKQMKRDYCTFAIEEARKGLRVCHFWVARWGDRKTVQELLSLTSNPQNLNEMLDGMCEGRHSDLCDNVVLAGATCCNTCGDINHRRLHHWVKCALVWHMGLDADAAGVIIAVLCELVV